MNTMIQNEKDITDYKFDSNLISWYLYIHYGIMKPLKWQKPLFEILSYAMAGRVSKITVDAPPQHGKTELAINTFGSYYMVNCPNDQVIVTAYSQDRATKYGLSIRNIINKFGEHTHYKPKLRQDQQSKTNFMLDDPYTGELLASGSHGSIMGNPANLVIIDDPIKELKEAKSKVMQDNLKEWYLGSINTRLRKNSMGRPPIVLILAQRLDEHDMQGIIKEIAPTMDGFEALQILRNGGSIDKDTFVVMNFPALCIDESTDLCNRRKGEPLWSNHKNKKDLLNDRKLMGEYRFNTIMQGRPMKQIGTLFKREWFYNKEGKLNCIVPIELVKPMLRKIRTWDLSARFDYTDLDGADEVSGVLTSKDPVNNTLYVYNLVNGKFTANQLLNTMKKTIYNDGNNVITNIEQEGGSHSVLFITQLENEMNKYKVIHHKPVGSKAYRAIELQALAETGRLKFVIDAQSNKDWITKTIEQLIAFDGSDSNAKEKKHDDILDSLSASANYWLVDSKQPVI